MNTDHGNPTTCTLPCRAVPCHAGVGRAEGQTQTEHSQAFNHSRIPDPVPSGTVRKWFPLPSYSCPGPRTQPVGTLQYNR